MVVTSTVVTKMINYIVVVEKSIGVLVSISSGLATCLLVGLEASYKIVTTYEACIFFFLTTARIFLE